MVDDYTIIIILVMVLSVLISIILALGDKNEMTALAGPCWNGQQTGAKMKTCVRLLKCDTGHRVLGHEGKCAHPHGHEYRFEIEACADDLDSIGRVIDFSVLKAKIGKWIDENWDHNFIVNSEDEYLIRALFSVPGTRAPFVFFDGNPTAENLAAYLLNVVCPRELKETGVQVTRVRVWETQNCFAEARLV